MAAPHLHPPEPDPTHKQTKPTSGNRPAEVFRSSVMKSRWLRIAAIVVAVFLVLLLALPLFINVNSFRPKIESAASTALGRQVTVGDLSLSILSGSVGAENIAIADDPAFSKSPFVAAKSLKVGVELLPLIFSWTASARPRLLLILS